MYYSASVCLPAILQLYASVLLCLCLPLCYSASVNLCATLPLSASGLLYLCLPLCYSTSLLPCLPASLSISSVVVLFVSPWSFSWCLWSWRPPKSRTFLFQVVHWVAFLSMIYSHVYSEQKYGKSEENLRGEAEKVFWGFSNTSVSCKHRSIILFHAKSCCRYMKYINKNLVNGIFLYESLVCLEC